MESKQTMENLEHYIFTIKTGKISTEKGMPRFSTTGFLFVLGRKIKVCKKEKLHGIQTDHGEPSILHFYSKNRQKKHRKRHAQVLHHRIFICSWKKNQSL